MISKLIILFKGIKAAIWCRSSVNTFLIDSICKKERYNLFKNARPLRLLLIFPFFSNSFIHSAFISDFYLYYILQALYLRGDQVSLPDYY